MLNCQFVSIERWPAGESRRTHKRAVFRVSYPKRLDLLESELNKLRGRNIVVQAFFSARDIRNDGWPRSSVRPQRPGVIVSFIGSNKEQFSFPCDTYDAWEDNLYAIALSLEALRTVDRYGVTKRGEQYQGWKRLAAPEHENSRTKDWAINHLAVLADVSPAVLKQDREAIQLAYRAAARRTHPDSGGNVEAFQLLRDAMTILDAA